MLQRTYVYGSYFKGIFVQYRYVWKSQWYIEGILSKGSYPPCLRMTDRALLAGYPRYLDELPPLMLKDMDKIRLTTKHDRAWTPHILGCIVYPLSTTSIGLFNKHNLTLIQAWICNHMPGKMCDESAYPFPNFSGCTVEVWEWISNFVPHFILPCCQCSESCYYVSFIQMISMLGLILVKGDTGSKGFDAGLTLRTCYCLMNRFQS